MKICRSLIYWPEQTGNLCDYESLALSGTYGGRSQAGVTLHLMAKIRLQAGQSAEALPHVQEAVTIFEETGSRHLRDAEATLRNIQAKIDLLNRSAENIRAC